MIQYDPHHWWRNLLDVRGGLVREIVGRVTACIGFSVAVTWFHLHVRPVGIPSTIHTLSGTALSLLLVFRTNSSYDRFWEGRKLWGGIVNETRNVVRAAQATVSSTALVARLAAWTSAFPWALVRVLRGSQTGLGAAERALPPEEVAEVLASRNAGVAVARKMSSVIAQARRDGLVSDYVQMQLDQNVQLLVDYQGGCERIHKTPMPFAYMVHLRRTLVLFCFTLPFALVETYGWLTVLDVTLVAFIFFGIEEIGVEIEDPFGTDENDLPLEDISQNIGELLNELAPYLPREPRLDAR